MRVLTIMIAGFLTVAGTLALKATQSAALSTTLLVSLGTMEPWRAILSIVISVGLMAAMGQPLRQIRVRQLNRTG